jgi:hypothetical protein
MVVLERQTGNFAVLTYAVQGCVCPPCTMHMLPDSQSSALPTVASALCMACCMLCSCTLDRNCACSVQCIFARDVCNFGWFHKLWDVSPSTHVHVRGAVWLQQKYLHTVVCWSSNDT